MELLVTRTPTLRRQTPWRHGAIWPLKAEARWSILSFDADEGHAVIAFSQVFKDALSAHIRGTVDLDQVLALAGNRKAEASFIVEHTLTDAHSKHLTQDQIRRLLEVLWRLEGPAKCLGFQFIGVNPVSVVGEFIADRLAGYPNEFTYADLHEARHRWGNNPKVARNAQKLLDTRVMSLAVKSREGSTELGADVARLKERVSEYHFTPVLNDLLDKVESGIGSGDPFDQKALLAHLRTFFESLHCEAGERLRRGKPETVDGTDLTKCGQAIDYLQRKHVLTDKMQALGRALYGVLNVGNRLHRKTHLVPKDQIGL